MDQVALQGLAECVTPEGKFKGFMASMANAAKSSDTRGAKRGLSHDGCMQLTSDVSQLVRCVAAAQPRELSNTDAFRLMTVQKMGRGTLNSSVLSCSGGVSAILQRVMLALCIYAAH